MKNSETIKRTGQDELFGVENEESAMNIEMRKIREFISHPFKVTDNERIDREYKHQWHYLFLFDLLEQIKELEKYGIVTYTVHPTVPSVVEYQLSDFEQEIIPIMSAMNQWGKICKALSYKASGKTILMESFCKSINRTFWYMRN